MSSVIGIDPGTKTGVAVFDNGRLTVLHSTDFFGAMEFVFMLVDVDQIIIEKSTETRVWSDNAQSKNKGTALKIAQSVGGVRREAELLEKHFTDKGYNVKTVEPKSKGAKVNAKRFKAITGWDRSSNEHTRDAAMLVYANSKMIEVTK